MLKPEPKTKVVLYRDLENGYRWRLRSATGETLAVSASGHPQKSACEAELRALLAERHADAEVLDLTVARTAK
jgi:uncharacterized protein YegP (UPF0339 family)